MKNKKEIIYLTITIIALIFPIGFLLDFISAKVAFPVIFTLLGCQQLFNGLFMESKNNKLKKVLSIIFGILFIIFGIFVVLPTYYF